MTHRDFSTRLERRLSRADVLMPPAEVVSQVAAYYDLLSHWNARINLTSLPLHDAPPATLDRLIVEPLAAARHVLEEPLDWLDLGSGGGSPAIPLKLVRPLARLWMVEATTKKAAFLREVVRKLGLVDASVENSRIEALVAQADLAKRFDLVTARALRMTKDLFSTIRVLLGPSGKVHLYATRAPELPQSSGLKIQSVVKLGSGLETMLVILSVEADVPRGTSRPSPASLDPRPRRAKTFKKR
jgi:16S rRNA (guanine527-N7)-methyltransferase